MLTPPPPQHTHTPSLTAPISKAVERARLAVGVCPAADSLLGRPFRLRWGRPSAAPGRGRAEDPAPVGAELPDSAAGPGLGLEGAAALTLGPAGLSSAGSCPSEAGGRGPGAGGRQLPDCLLGRFLLRPLSSLLSEPPATQKPPAAPPHPPRTPPPHPLLFYLLPLPLPSPSSPSPSISFPPGVWQEIDILEPRD